MILENKITISVSKKYNTTVFLEDDRHVMLNRWKKGDGTGRFTFEISSTDLNDLVSWTSAPRIEGEGTL